MIEYDLNELYIAANDACEEAINRRDELRGAVNWADLSCVSAERCVNHLGEVGYRVLIEECDPGANAFRSFVFKYLKDAGFVNVDVATEW